MEIKLCATCKCCPVLRVEAENSYEIVDRNEDDQELLLWEGNL